MFYYILGLRENRQFRHVNLEAMILCLQTFKKMRQIYSLLIYSLQLFYEKEEDLGQQFLPPFSRISIMSLQNEFLNAFPAMALLLLLS